MRLWLLPLRRHPGLLSLGLLLCAPDLLLPFAGWLAALPFLRLSLLVLLACLSPFLRSFRALAFRGRLAPFVVMLLLLRTGRDCEPGKQKQTDGTCWSNEFHLMLHH